MRNINLPRDSAIILSLQKICEVNGLKEGSNMKAVYYFRKDNVRAGFVLPDEKEAMNQFFEQRIAEDDKQPVDISDPDLIEKSDNELG